jgi:glycosyltransferase involved in cell wall biosynthesis
MFLVTAYLGEPHGSAKSARDIARALLAVHDDVHIVSPRVEHFDESVVGHALAAPVWHKYPRRGTHGSTERGLLSSARDGYRRLAISRAAAGHIVVVNGWASYRYWKQLAVKGHQHSVIIVRESPRHFEGGDRPEKLEALLSGLSEFDRLIFVSDRLREEWSQFTKLTGKPTFYLPNCCEEEDVARVCQLDRQEVRHRLGMARDELILICPGTIEKRKGQDIVLESWRAVLDAIPNARLVLLGDGGTDWGKIIAADIDRGKFGGRVSRIPSQPCALEHLYAADVLLCPSRAEAMPRTVLEGMALGMPIVATNVDGIPELVEAGVSGLLFHPTDASGMLERLHFIATHCEQARQLGAEARRRYATAFSRARQIERTRDLLTWLETTGMSQRQVWGQNARKSSEP